MERQGWFTGEFSHQLDFDRFRFHPATASARHDSSRTAARGCDCTPVRRRTRLFLVPVRASGTAVRRVQASAARGPTRSCSRLYTRRRSFTTNGRTATRRTRTRNRRRTTTSDRPTSVVSHRSTTLSPTPSRITCARRFGGPKPDSWLDRSVHHADTVASTATIPSAVQGSILDEFANLGLEAVYLEYRLSHAETRPEPFPDARRWTRRPLEGRRPLPSRECTAPTFRSVLFRHP